MDGEDCDLYDDIFIQDNHEEEDNLEDLYGNIHNPEVAETALEKVKSLTSKCDKLENQNTELKRQVSILTNLNQELTNKNQNLETIMMRVKLPDDAFPRLPTQADKKAAKMKVA